MIDKTRHRTSARRRQAVSRLSALLAGCIACLLASGAIAAPDNYLSAARDIPLLPGLQESADGPVLFDKPQGRIIRITASDPQKQVSAAQVLGFYQQALPNLGWQQQEAADDSLTFKRESEMLRISTVGDLVIFDLTPVE